MPTAARGDGDFLQIAPPPAVAVLTDDDLKLLDSDKFPLEFLERGVTPRLERLRRVSSEVVLVRCHECDTSSSARVEVLKTLVGSLAAGITIEIRVPPSPYPSEHLSSGAEYVLFLEGSVIDGDLKVSRDPVGGLGLLEWAHNDVYQFRSPPRVQMNCYRNLEVR
jgi:hypothetical protein